MWLSNETLQWQLTIVTSLLIYPTDRDRIIETITRLFKSSLPFKNTQSDPLKPPRGKRTHRPVGSPSFHFHCSNFTQDGPRWLRFLPGRRSCSQPPGKFVRLFGETLRPRLLTCQSSLPRWQTGQRVPLKPLKSVIQHAQLLASWIGHRAGSRALLNSRCFTLRPLPSFPGRRAARSIRRVTGTRKGRERKGQSERVQEKS